jgi:hypothetical protein
MATKADIPRSTLGNRCKSLLFIALGAIENLKNIRIFWHKIR